MAREKRPRKVVSIKGYKSRRARGVQRPNDWEKLKTAVIQDVALGVTKAVICKEHGIDAREYGRILWREQNRQENLARIRATMREHDWRDKIIEESKVSVFRGITEPEFYNPAKIAVSALKGLGIFASDRGKGGDTHNTVNLQLGIICEMSEEQLEQWIAANKPESRSVNSSDRGSLSPAEEATPADQGRCIVVAAECDENI